MPQKHSGVPAGTSRSRWTRRLTSWHGSTDLYDVESVIGIACHLVCSCRVRAPASPTWLLRTIVGPGGGFWKSALYVVVPVNGVVAQRLGLDAFGRPTLRGACSADQYCHYPRWYPPRETVHGTVHSFGLRPQKTEVHFSQKRPHEVHFAQKLPSFHVSSIYGFKGLAFCGARSHFLLFHVQVTS